jgi:group I intron endonuclease
VITNLANGKKYVGYTSKLVEARWNEHKTHSKNPRYRKRRLYQAFNKYGIENFSCRYVGSAHSLEQAKCFEQRVIAVHDSFQNGYNMTPGGDGSGPHSEEHKAKMSVLMTGRKLSAESKRKMSLSKKGQPKSEDFKKRVSETMKLRRRERPQWRPCDKPK